MHILCCCEQHGGRAEQHDVGTPDIAKTGECWEGRQSTENVDNTLHIFSQLFKHFGGLDGGGHRLPVSGRGVLQALCNDPSHKPRFCWCNHTTLEF